MLRIAAALLSIVFLAGSVFAWIVEVPPEWRFDHAMRFAIASGYWGLFFAVIAVRGDYGHAPQ
jgi:hypothetical protein